MKASSFNILKISTAALSIAAAVVSARPASFKSLRLRAQGYDVPSDNGGSMLTQTDAATGGLGEPLNVIISSESDAGVLTPAGIEEYLESLYFSPGSCIGLSLGGPQTANLGDGNAYVNQTQEMRFNYYQGDGGSCLESLRGGNHLRYFFQNGSTADTGAIFMAVSYEYNATLAHDIVPDGYDLGRDLLVGNATNSTGTKSPGGFEYTTINTAAALLSSVSASELNHDISVDGNVAVLTVRITKTGTLGANRNAAGTSGGTSTSGSRSAKLIQVGSITLAVSLTFAGLFLVI